MAGGALKHNRAVKKAEIEQRRQIVAANLLAGLNYREIANALGGIAVSTVAADVRALEKQWRESQADRVDRWKLLESRRLDRALNAIWEKVLGGDLLAVDRFLKIAERRAKLLGYDAPTKLAQTTGDGEDVTLDQLSPEEKLAQLLGLYELAKKRALRGPVVAGDAELPAIEVASRVVDLTRPAVAPALRVVGRSGGEDDSAAG